MHLSIVLSLLVNTTYASTTPAPVANLVAPAIKLNVTDNHCMDPQPCILQDQCPPFLEMKERVRKITEQNRTHERSGLINDLRDSVCNHMEKGVCCPCTGGHPNYPCCCHNVGSLNPTCDKTSQKCSCKDNFRGRYCDKCRRGFWNITSSCSDPCECDKEGTGRQDCQIESGQCFCIEGVEGRKCDMCKSDAWAVERLKQNIKIESKDGDFISEVIVNVTIPKDAVCPFKTRFEVKFAPLSDPRVLMPTSTLPDGIKYEKSFVLKRFQTYTVTLTACDDQNRCDKSKLIYESNLWKCGDGDGFNDTTITQDRLCNNPQNPDCPNGKDESPETCQKKVSFEYWLPSIMGLFTTVILGYLALKINNKSQPVQENYEYCDEMEILKKGRKTQFRELYSLWHSDCLSSRTQLVEYFYLNCPDFTRKVDIAKWIAEEEFEHHRTPEAMYQCIKDNFPDMSIITQISETKSHRLVNSITKVVHNTCFTQRDKIVWITKSKMFLLLCLSLYDYVKDSEIAIAINHYNVNIIQGNFDQIGGLNLTYMLYTMIVYMVLSQALAAFYWFLRRERPKFLKSQAEENLFVSLAKQIAPYIPGVLPILIFCESVSIMKEIRKPRDLTTFDRGQFEKVMSSLDEIKTLKDIRLDLKSIDVVAENSVQLILQTIVLYRLESILAEESKFGLPFNFRDLVIATMLISGVTMVLHLQKYQNRNRKHLRPFLTIGTLIQLTSWCTLIGYKLFLYSLCFINYPGLIFAPRLISLVFHYVVLRFTSISPSFRLAPLHTQMIQVLMHSLVPLTNHSDDKNYSAIFDQIVSNLLYFLECASLILFACLMKTYYHFQPYGRFLDSFSSSQAGLSTIAQLLDTEEGTKFYTILLFLFVLLIAVILFSSILQLIYQSCCHPKRTFFAKIITEVASKVKGGQQDSSGKPDAQCCNLRGPRKVLIAIGLAGLVLTSICLAVALTFARKNLEGPSATWSSEAFLSFLSEPCQSPFCLAQYGQCCSLIGGRDGRIFCPKIC